MAADEACTILQWLSLRIKFFRRFGRAGLRSWPAPNVMLQLLISSRSFSGSWLMLEMRFCGSTKLGLYFEPRDEATRSAHPGFAVVWIPQGDLERAQHLLRTTPEALAIARLKSRYGLRVTSKNEQVVHEALRPNADFVQVRSTYIYRLHIHYLMGFSGQTWPSC